MMEFKNRVACITGSGSGIGAAVARRCASEGMRLVLADINEERLEQLVKSLAEFNVEVLTLVTDVSKAEDVEQLASSAYSKFGAVHLLVNNAGVLHVAPLLEHTKKDWEWVLGVNLFGVIHGIRIFGPLMKNQSVESHIVNTASIAAFTSGPGLAAYRVAKHAVLALSEVLFFEMAETKVGVSVLCPGWVNTEIMASESQRPNELRNHFSFEPTDSEVNRLKGLASARNGASPTELASVLFDGIKRGAFYIVNDNSFEPKFLTRMENILKQKNPT
jgi:NAD(P)-dependent dehydrogenase (short-subunit alcohol dehydrogenase family)